MKIVYNIAGTYNSGGMERVLANKVNYLAGLGHEINIITTDQRDRPSYFEMDPNILQWDLSINYPEHVNANIFQKSASYIYKQKLHKRRLEELLKLLKADIVISMFDHEAPFLYKIKDGSKKILEIHFSRYKRLQYGRRGLIGLADRYRSKEDLEIAKKYDRFVVLTKEDQGYWGNLSNMQVIPNSNSFEPARTADLTEKRVIAVGRFDGQKAFHRLIQAWKMVHEAYADWSLVIFGQGPLKRDLEKLIEQLALQNVVTLSEPVLDIQKEYLHSSILAMTSRYEGLPMALLEGQVHGLPLVSFDCKCGPKDIIENGVNGYLIEEGDVSNLTGRIIELIGDPILRIKMGNASRSKSENYSKALVMKQWTGLFDSLKAK